MLVQSCPVHFSKRIYRYDKAIETLGYPFIVKTRFGGYDGKGQVLINNEKDLQEGFKLIETSECVAENI
ncbi:Phosphoribosylaminoimidazole carboxylase ATPase subunit [Staphylococcus aureus]|uniref:Phosphoribosylaminoimidazole carboxylase ATPase subunit n=1 Tax=Staphylococcus aureus TaxID=1280 RepID=A0A380EID6_STAAU|nr:Phosphoribosylaminoimidazole carboxylase ATPase subunit [Staphylococcus aureus]